MIRSILFLACLVMCCQAAPVPRPKAKKPTFVPGVYRADGSSFYGVLWFHPDGRYGARWTGTLYEGTWKVEGDKIHIMEHETGYVQEDRLWVIDIPGSKGWFKLSLMEPLTK